MYDHFIAIMFNAEYPPYWAFVGFLWASIFSISMTGKPIVSTSAGAILTVITYAFTDAHLSVSGNIKGAYISVCIYAVIISFIAYLIIEYARYLAEKSNMVIKILGKSIIVSDDKIVYLSPLLLSYAVTYFFAIAATHSNGNEFWRGFYVSWSEDIVFFTIVGAAVALIGMKSPESEDFETRVKILFAGKKGDAVSHLTEAIRKIGYYTTHMERTVEIEEYCAEYDAYKIAVTTNHTIRNFIEDIASESPGRVQIEADEWEGGGPTIAAQITSIIIPEKGEIVSSPIDVGQGKKEGLTFPIPVSRNEEQTMHFSYWAWAKVGEIQAHRVSRFSEHLKTTVINRWHDKVKVPAIDVCDREKNPKDTDTLGYNELIVVAENYTLDPDDLDAIYVLRAPIDKVC